MIRLKNFFILDTQLDTLVGDASGYTKKDALDAVMDMNRNASEVMYVDESFEYEESERFVVLRAKFEQIE